MSLFEKLFPNVKPLKTHAGAERRLDGALPQRESFFGGVVEMHGGFVPVVILEGQNEHLAGLLVQQDIAVTTRKTMLSMLSDNQLFHPFEKGELILDFPEALS